ncbi:MAG: acyl-CoA dehydrogenase family protein [Desulfobulbus sp.]|nr:acyl-CoA dehydrogenase family protein [Desulfobulbus sp.]
MSADLEMIAMLSESARRYAADRYDFLQRHAVLGEPRGYSGAAWRDYAELGWLSLCLPESEGGLEADALAVGTVMEVVGSHLLMEPVLASAVVGASLVTRQASAEQQARLLPALADGSLKLALAAEECAWRNGKLSGAAAGVLHGDVANRFIVGARDADGGFGLYLVAADSPQVSRKSYRLVDGRGAASARFDNAEAERLGDDGSAEAALAAVCDEAVAALCAEANGIVKILVATTCDYLKVRRQFGRPIGDNQALQHRAADMYLLQQEVAALTRAAQRALGQPAAERARIVSGARAYIANAARHVANEAVQMHGGLGVTEELNVSHYFRRLMVNAALFGSRDQHFVRFVDATLSKE